MLNVHSTSFIFQDLEQSKINQIPLKTPARSMKRQRTVHNENSVYGHPKALGIAGKKNHAILSTPIHNISTQFQPYMTSKHIARSGNPPILSEITNRTPFIKRDSTSQTVSSIFSKPLKSFRVFDDSTTLSTHRISSTRKSSRLPLSANKNFETPNTAGDHWNVSDITIDASIHQDENAPEENYDELEYLPPTAIDPPYEPEFDMPNFTDVGKTIISLFRQLAVLNQDDETNTHTATSLYDPAPLQQLDLPDLTNESIVPYSCFSRPDLSIIEATPICSSRIPKPPRGWMRKTANVDRHLSRIPVLSYGRISEHRAAKPLSHARNASLYSVPYIDASSKSHTRARSLPTVPTGRIQHEITPLVTPSDRSSQSLGIAEDALLGLLTGPSSDITSDDFFFNVE